MLKYVQTQEVNSISLTVIELLQISHMEKGAVLKYQKVRSIEQWWFSSKALRSNKRVNTY